MENPFKQIIVNQKVPEVLRDKVMEDVRLIKLSLDVADLAAIKYPDSLLNLLGSVSTENKKKNDKN